MAKVKRHRRAGRQTCEKLLDLCADRHLEPETRGGLEERLGAIGARRHEQQNSRQGDCLRVLDRDRTKLVGSRLASTEPGLGQAWHRAVVYDCGSVWRPSIWL